MSALHAAKAPPPFLGTCAGGPWDGLTYAAEYRVRQILAPEGLLGRYEHNGEGWDWVQVMEAEVNFAKKFDFGDAVCALKAGKKVRRVGWGLVISYTEDFHGDGPRITRDFSGVALSWYPEQADMLAEDWEIVE
jgi:hypothetical protein